MTKTHTPEVLCDACGAVIPAGWPDALFVTLKGIVVRHRKADFCNFACLRDWARARADDRYGAPA